MGFNAATLGFNEPTLTQLAYVCYLLSFLFYSVHLFTRSAGVVRVASAGMALAGAGGGGGGTVDFTVSGSGGRAEGEALVFASPWQAWLCVRCARLGIAHRGADRALDQFGPRALCDPVRNLHDAGVGHDHQSS